MTLMDFCKKYNAEISINYDYRLNVIKLHFKFPNNFGYRIGVGKEMLKEQDILNRTLINVEAEYLKFIDSSEVRLNGIDLGWLGVGELIPPSLAKILSENPAIARGISKPYTYIEDQKMGIDDLLLKELKKRINEQFGIPDKIVRRLDKIPVPVKLGEVENE